MSEEYYNSKKTDDICDDVCGQVLFFPISLLIFLLFNLFSTVLKIWFFFLLLFSWVSVWLGFVANAKVELEFFSCFFFWVCVKFNSFSKFVGFFFLFLFQIWIQFFFRVCEKFIPLSLCIDVWFFFSLCFCFEFRDDWWVYPLIDRALWFFFLQVF